MKKDVRELDEFFIERENKVNGWRDAKIYSASYCIKHNVFFRGTEKCPICYLEERELETRKEIQEKKLFIKEPTNKKEKRLTRNQRDWAHRDKDKNREYMREYMAKVRAKNKKRKAEHSI
jgi:hypothetical protein